ncbi:DUF3783 domain-containing protein [Oscillibacter sp.]|uniref:DUF3783 domain-containing protein n=1 Tax=Oscillibacter sp. TaxID=1945593 RepID=UPI0028985F28|nr:DUF3783 domain-containing protein [Oscillibacter sp.]
MAQKMHRQGISLLLALVILLSLAVPPAFAAQAVVSIKDTEITTQTNTLTVNLTQVPTTGLLRVFQLNSGAEYTSDLFNNETYRLAQGIITNLKVGDNELTLSTSPVAGKKIVAVLRDGSGDSPVDYVSESLIVAGSPVVTDPSAILANCRVSLQKDGAERTEPFREDETSVNVKVSLDETVEQCTLTIYAYAGNTTFSPDAPYNKSLWSGTVKNDDAVTCDFNGNNLPLTVGYKIIACLNVPVGEDNYRPINSQALQIVDDSGKGFEDYTYPNVTIDETVLHAGATSLHISLTGDERLFQAVRDGKTSITCAVAQYPDGDAFDFESSKQIPLKNNLQITEAFNGKEIQLNEPLREGYRVRAVVYWAQNQELFLPKGNDYEAVFNRPDDSVLVSAAPDQETLTVAVSGPVESNAASVSVTVGGVVPDGSILLLKSYPAGVTEFTSDSGDPYGVKAAPVTGTNTIAPNPGVSLTAGKQLVAFVLNGGAAIAQSQPVTVEAAPGLTVSLVGKLTPESTQAVFQVTSRNSGVTNLNVVRLCKVVNGVANTAAPLKTKTGQSPGQIAFDLTSAALAVGDQVCLVITYVSGETITFTSGAFTVAAAVQPGVPSVTLQSSEITADTTSIAVSLANIPTSGILRVIQLDANEKYAGDKLNNYTSLHFAVLSSLEIGENTLALSPAPTPGKKILVVMRNGGVNPSVDYLSDPMIVSGEVVVPAPTAKILDTKITAGMTHVNVGVTFDVSVGAASYTLYQFTGSALDIQTAKVLGTGTLPLSAAKRTLYFGAGSLTAGANLQLMVTAGKQQTLSNIVAVQPSPNWGTPYSAFEAAAIPSDAQTIPVTIDYSDEYLTMGNDFYCTATVYQFPANYTDREFEEDELWESPKATVVGQISSRSGDTAKGKVEIPVREGTTLIPGNRLIVKLRLPHVEWAEEEVDYFSVSAPIVSEGTTMAGPKIALYNLGENTSRGMRLRSILSGLGIEVLDVLDAELNQTVGYLAGLDGYETAEKPYSGSGVDTEFMLICNLSDALLDRFLAGMQADGLRIDHKAVVTEYNREMQYHELIDDIAEEHEVFQALLALDAMVDQAQALSEADYGAKEHWTALQEAIIAGIQVLSSYEPTLEALTNANRALQEQYLLITERTVLTGAAVISVEKSEDGTYVMTAQVKGGEEGTQYHYAWSTGADTQSISDIAPGKLIGTTVMITADQKFGTLKAQLEVPKAPKATVQSGTNSLEVRWIVPENTDNCPMPDSYVISLYQGMTLLKTLTPEAAATSAAFDALSEQTEYTITINAISPVGQSDRLTLSAATTKASSGGSSGGGGSSGNSSGSGSPAVNTATSGNTTTATATVTPTVSGTTANVTVSSATVTSAVNSALAAAQKNSTAPAVKVAVNTPPKADSLSVTIPADALETLAGHKDAALTITSGVAQVTLDRNALMAVARQGGADVTVSVKPVPISDLNTVQKRATGDSKVFDISIASGSAAEIHDLGGGAASVSIPYTLAKGETAATLTVYYLADNGSLTACETSYDGTSGMVTFVTPHFSKYMVGYRTAAAFTDVASTAYYYDAVQWAVEQGITAGNSATTFAPGQNCTRAQIVTFLWRASGSPVPTASENPFTDVSENAYYYHAVLWAVEKGITSGFSATTFAPNAVSNRAQVVTFLWRAEGSPAVSGAVFSDVSADAYYAQAVTWAMDRGIASGRSNGQFVPADFCTRAQAVTFLYRTMDD